MSATTAKELKELKRRVRALAGSLEIEVDWDSWEMVAPDGRRFASTGTHIVVFEPWSVTRPDGVEILGNDQIAEAYNHALKGSALRLG